MSNSKTTKASTTSLDWHHDNCFGCGPKNAMSMMATFPFVESVGEVHFNYAFNINQEGALGYAHGGIIAALLDEAQGTLCFHLGHFVMTDQLFMSYHKAVSLDEPLFIKTKLSLVRRKRLYTKGSIENKNGEVLVSSKARWYIMPDRIIKRMFQGKMPESEHERLQSVLSANLARSKVIRRRLRQI